MLTLFWYFLIYSFLGFVLEILFARVTHARKRDRKCFLLLPLCPVYGLGALAILGVSAWVGGGPLGTALAGGAAATAVEYLMGVFYQRGLGVTFWDYSQFRWNIGGQVCPPFALAWGLLSLALVHWVHPGVRVLTAAIPAVLGPAAVVLVLLDGAVSIWLLKGAGTTEILRWYDQNGVTIKEKE